VRYWADDAPVYTEEWLSRTAEALVSTHEASFGKPHNYLAISGGGSNGAFSAGILKGWSETGTRPEFTVVTGISTGALIAPFAFLGPEYDHVLETVYTQYGTEDLLETHSLLEALTGEAATDSSRLRGKIAEHMDESVMEAIAAEYRRGRAMLITTTNLDAARPVTWEIGRIAASSHPDALELIRDVMLASASIPGALPPVMFQVTANGQSFDELHVDGGTTSMVNLYPLDLDWNVVLERLQVAEPPNLYVIRNGFIENNYQDVERRAISIAGRSISTMMTHVVKGDLYQLFLEAQRDGLGFHLAFIPETFDVPSTEPFDKAYMGQLFQLGYDMARNGYPWQRTPPDYFDSQAAARDGGSARP
jgi:predicted acylesterase/phospholipase RssA